MYSHIVQEEIHQDFLSENRQDPITGDLIETGNEVVFCASCKSAFLKSSWEYLGKTHCNQTDTLEIFPKSEGLTLRGYTQENNTTFIWDNFKLATSKAFLRMTDNTLWRQQDTRIGALTKEIITTKKAENLELAIPYSIQYPIAILGVLMSAILGFSIEENSYYYTFGGILVFGAWLAFMLYYQESEGGFEVESVQKYQSDKLVSFKEDKLVLFFVKEAKSLELDYEHISHINFSIHYNSQVQIDVITTNLKSIKLKLKGVSLDGLEEVVELITRHDKYITIELKNSSRYFESLLEQLESRYDQVFVS